MTTATQTQTRTTLKTPSMWAIVVHNDDYTPFDFVIEVLERFLNMTNDQAADAAQRVHTRGKDKLGRFTKEIAITKTTQITDLATRNGHPLKVTAEEAG